MSLLLSPLWRLLAFFGVHLSRSDDVDDFLRDIALGSYADSFRSVGFASEEDMLSMTEGDLLEDVKVPFAVQRRRILTHAARRRALAARESIIWWLLCTGATAFVVALGAFAVALCCSSRLRTHVGA